MEKTETHNVINLHTEPQGSFKKYNKIIQILYASLRSTSLTSSMNESL